MTESGRQLVFDLPLRPALGQEDFIVSASNEAAVRMIDLWPDWPEQGLILTGPTGSGKTHLAHVWQALSGAGMAPAAGLDEATAIGLAATGGAVVENLEEGIGDERALFHLLNLAREQRFHVLLTARTQPGEWQVSLPDLRSRLRALAVVAIDPPDDGLLRAVLVKLISDRQLPATPHAIDYLARHMERSMATAIALIEELDRMLWESPKEISRDTARQALARLGQAEPE